VELMNGSIPPAFRLFLGVAEVLAAVGLILPGLTRVLTWLVPCSAAGLMMVMIGAIRVSLLSIVYYALGRTGESDAALSELTSKYKWFSYEIAQIYGFRKEPDKACQWLDRAYDQRTAV